MTGSSEPGYPFYRPANWMELLFHWPFRSEGFDSELTVNHPNVPADQIGKGFGRGGFGALHFSDYLLLIGLDSSNQNWEGLPPKGLRDWEGNLITDKWPWFETHHSEVRQDIWLKNLLEPEDGPSAGEVYDYIIPVIHRGLFGPTRKQMTLKNSPIMEYWLPVFYRNNVKFIKEGHEHIYARSVPMGISTEQPENTNLEKIYYKPRSWDLTDDLPQEYLDTFYGIDVLKDPDTGEIVGWYHKGHYITYEEQGMRAFGHGGWAAGRRTPGDRGGGNAGLWFVDRDRGGDYFGGPESWHINVVRLTPDGLITEGYQTDQLPLFEQGLEPEPVHQIKWDKRTRTWDDQ